MQASEGAEVPPRIEQPGPRTPAKYQPRDHRAHEDTCLYTTMPAPPMPALKGDCRSDADCSREKNGRCSAVPGGMGLRNLCIYNECTADPDCGEGRACTCDPDRARNKCVPASCRSDGNCGPGGYCSPTAAMECPNLHPLVGFACHTNRDDCTEDSECGLYGICVFDNAQQKWVCAKGNCLD